MLELQFENCEIWLSSFVAYMMVSKAGLIIESQRYNNLFSKLNVEKLYPGFFETSCMVSGIEDWVCCGDWDENRIRFELSAELNRSKAKLPIEIVKSYLLPEVDDSVIKDGYPELLRQEMVDVSFEIFKNSGNANKNSFSMWFEGMWHRYKDMQDINIEIHKNLI